MYNTETKILITGGAGFIGTNFINDLLKRGHNPDRIAVVDNLSHGTYLPQVHDKITNFFREDIRNEYVKTIIAEFKPEYIYHFAGLVSIYYKYILNLLSDIYIKIKWKIKNMPYA